MNQPKLFRADLQAEMSKFADDVINFEDVPPRFQKLFLSVFGAGLAAGYMVAVDTTKLPDESRLKSVTKNLDWINSLKDRA
jgi:hypothetical protein